jgi:hypothetical protein
VVAKTLPENLIGKPKSTISGWTLKNSRCAGFINQIKQEVNSMPDFNLCRDRAFLLGIDRETFEKFGDIAKYCEYQPGEIIIREREPKDEILLIEEGQVEVFKTGAKRDSQEHKVTNLVNGQAGVKCRFEGKSRGLQYYPGQHCPHSKPSSAGNNCNAGLIIPFSRKWKQKIGKL